MWWMLGAMARARPTAYMDGPIDLDVELETLLCGRHRNETMCKKGTVQEETRHQCLSSEPADADAQCLRCIKFVRCEHRDLKRGCAMSKASVESRILPS